MPSKVDVAKRQLVRLLRELGHTYEVQVVVTRDSPPEEINRAFRSVARKAHPDKPGGCTKDFQALSAKHDAWADLHKTERPVGRPPRVRPLGSKDGKQGAVALPVSSSAGQRREFRFQAKAVLLTYQGFTADLPDALQAWRQFVQFVKRNKKAWGLNHWTATLETNQDGKHHIHLMADFFQAVDRTARSFIFDGRCPNASPNDLLGDGWSRSGQWQISVDRGHFYVYANKKGTARDSKRRG